MDNASHSPVSSEKPKPQKLLAYLFFLLGAVVALVGVLFPIAQTLSPQSDERTASSLVSLGWAVPLGMLAYFFFVKGRELLKSGLYGRVAFEKNALHKIASVTSDHSFFEKNSQRGRYKESSNLELLSVYDTIKPDLARESFDELIREIHDRTKSSAETKD